MKCSDYNIKECAMCRLRPILQKLEENSNAECELNYYYNRIKNIIDYELPIGQVPPP